MQVKEKESFELDNGTHNLKAFPGGVVITNKKANCSCWVPIVHNMDLSALCDVIFNRD